MLAMSCERQPPPGPDSRSNGEEKLAKTPTEQVGETAPEPARAELAPEVKACLDKLNGWNKDELDAVERPDAHPGYEPSGETEAWVQRWKAELTRLGVAVTWNADRKRYEAGK